MDIKAIYWHTQTPETEAKPKMMIYIKIVESGKIVIWLISNSYVYSSVVLPVVAKCTFHITNIYTCRLFKILSDCRKKNINRYPTTWLSVNVAASLSSSTQKQATNRITLWACRWGSNIQVHHARTPRLMTMPKVKYQAIRTLESELFWWQRELPWRKRQDSNCAFFIANSQHSSEWSGSARLWVLHHGIGTVVSSRPQAFLPSSLRSSKRPESRTLSKMFQISHSKTMTRFSWSSLLPHRRKKISERAVCEFTVNMQCAQIQILCDQELLQF